MNTHECLKCGWTSITPDRVRVVFHPCYPDRVRRRLTVEQVIPYPKTTTRSMPTGSKPATQRRRNNEAICFLL